MTDDPGLVSTAPAPLDPEQLAHALARADLKAKLFGPPADSERVGRFSILRRVGAGGMGVVYAAYDEQLDRRIALKLVHGGRHDPTAAARMRREAQALARLSHPNVVHVYEIG
ncbi:MAG TPA: serine/threonine protein kinase, partial [Nannocystis sp.]